MCEWSLWNFFWILVAAFVGGFGWALAHAIFGRLTR